MKLDWKEIEKNIKYCLRCKSALKKSKKTVLVCATCDFHYYIDPQPTNAAILTNKNGEILLIKRKADPKPGWWDLPGGFIDPGETIEESMMREIKEELKIEIDDLKYIDSTADFYLYDDFNHPTICAIFTGKINDQIIRPSDDAEEARFFAPDKIPFEKIAFPSLVTALKKFISNSL